jgi:predicted metal-dependent HD superfamily phosphohydrolase
MVPDLLAAWCAALPDAEAGDAATTGRDLLARWAEPHRRYHTQTHLADVLRVVDGHGSHADDPGAVRLAAWYHDAVYDPTRTDNEELSAALAAATLPRLRVGPSRVTEVARLVRLSASHNPLPGDHNGALLCDADLSILAAEPPRYAAYARAIREEYAHVADPAFRSGRAAVLRALLELPALFHVPRLARAWEAPARANVARELTDLAGDASGGAGRNR